MNISCLNPKTIRNPYTKEFVQVPCGHCDVCYQRHSDSWVSRIKQEMQFSKFNLFITLTYDDSHLPIVEPSLSSVGLEYFDEVQSILETDLPSVRLVSHYNGIPYARVKDFQLFIKRLRQSLFRCKFISESESLLRYYAVSEFGPTTYRPHFHAVLFSESEYFACHAYDFISKAWSDYDKSTDTRTLIGRVDVQGVLGDAANYVAQYLHCITNLPQVLQHRLFKPFHLMSRRPPIGSHSFSDSSLRAILDGKTCCFTIEKYDTYEVVNIPLWRSFEAAWLPKCVGYYRLSFRGRYALYGVSSVFETFENFKSWFCSEWSLIISEHNDTLFGSLNSALRLSEEYGHFEFCGSLPLSLLNSLLRIWRLSNRVRLLRSKFNMSLHDYVSSIVRYYENKDYQCLKSQLVFEENFSKDNPRDLGYLLTLIDPLFYENKRSLSFDVRLSYLSQFGLSLETIDSFIFSDSSYFRRMVGSYLEYVRNGRCKRLRNEYLEQHPELLKLHQI